MRDALFQRELNGDTDMIDFEYYAPTKIFFGRGAQEKTGLLVREFGGTNVLVHYSGTAERLGLLDDVKAQLDGLGIRHTELGGVQPNPRLAKVYEGVELCRERGVDFILAIGGGSVIDSAKAIGVGAADEGDVKDFYLRKRTPQRSLPVATILTFAAAGSEMSMSTVITDEHRKMPLDNDICRPVFSIMNPALTYTLPPYQTASGIVDIMMHTLDRYFTPTERPMEITDEISEGLLRTVIRNAAVVMRKPDDYDARAEIMWAGALSHNGLTGCGQATDFAPHMLQHELGGMFDSAHGAGIAAVWGSWARHVYKTNPRRFAKIAVNVLGVQAGADDEQTALAGICAMEDFFRSIGMPISIAELEGFTLTDEQIDALARACVSRSPGGTIGAFQTLHLADVRAIYTAAR